MQVVLLSTYDLGRQPFGLASPAAWLRERGHEVTCVDLSVAQLPELLIEKADLIGVYLPMHTATRLAVKVLRRVRALNPDAHVCCYGLYAPLNADYLRSLGVRTILGGEFEESLVRLAEGEPAPEVSFERLSFRTPDRTTLPVLTQYARLRVGTGSKTVGYTEASRGCKHLCRHCPVVNVYQGRFRVVPADVVLADVRQQVAAGAQHITFGDPDFFNGPTHARRLVEALHQELPEVTYDVTIKVEHLRKQADLVPLLRDTGCLFVTSAVESLDDAVLEKLEKGHTREDFFAAADLLKRAGLALSPTFIPFTPWTTEESYRDLLETLAELDLVENVGPVQLALRLLVPAGSRLLELVDVQAVLTGYDEKALLHRWKHPEVRMDEWAQDVLRLVDQGQKRRLPRVAMFRAIANRVSARLPEEYGLMPRATVPYLDEPWYC